MISFVFCEMRIDNPMLHSHSYRCLAARSALAVSPSVEAQGVEERAALGEIYNYATGKTEVDDWEDAEDALRYIRQICEKINFQPAAQAPKTGDRTEERDGVARIRAERERQKSVEGWTPEHDDEHYNGELIAVAACYLDAALTAEIRPDATTFLENPPRKSINFWPSTWDDAWWKPSNDPTRNLEKAGALIAAEIDRLVRAAPAPAQTDASGEDAYAVIASALQYLISEVRNPALAALADLREGEKKNIKRIKDLESECTTSILVATNRLAGEVADARAQLSALREHEDKV